MARTVEGSSLYPTKNFKPKLEILNPQYNEVQHLNKVHLATVRQGRQYKEIMMKELLGKGSTGPVREAISFEFRFRSYYN